MEERITRDIVSKLVKENKSDLESDCFCILAGIDNLVMSGEKNDVAFAIYDILFREKLLGTYSEKPGLARNLMFSYNSLQIERRDIPVGSLVEDYILTDEKNLNPLSAYSYLLDELVLDLGAEPILSLEDEKYLVVLTAMSKVNPDVADGYRAIYNKLKESFAKRRNYPKKLEIVDIGKNRYGISLEDIH